MTSSTPLPILTCAELRAWVRQHQPRRLGCVVMPSLATMIRRRAALGAFYLWRADDSITHYRLTMDGARTHQRRVEPTLAAALLRHHTGRAETQVRTDRAHMADLARAQAEWGMYWHGSALAHPDYAPACAHNMAMSAMMTLALEACA